MTWRRNQKESKPGFGGYLAVKLRTLAMTRYVRQGAPGTGYLM